MIRFEQIKRQMGSGTWLGADSMYLNKRGGDRRSIEGRAERLRQSVLEFVLTSEAPVTKETVAKAHGMSMDHMKRILSALVNEGVIERTLQTRKQTKVAFFHKPRKSK